MLRQFKVQQCFSHGAPELIFLLQAEVLQEETPWEPGASFAKAVLTPSLGHVAGVYLFRQTVLLSSWDSPPACSYLSGQSLCLKNAEEEKSSLNHYHITVKFPSSVSVLMLWKTFNVLHIIVCFTQEISIGCCAIWGMWLSFYFWQIQTPRKQSPLAMTSPASWRKLCTCKDLSGR